MLSTKPHVTPVRTRHRQKATASDRHDKTRFVASSDDFWPGEHLVREVKTGYFGLGIGILDKMFGNPGQPRCRRPRMEPAPRGRISASRTAGHPAECAAKACARGQQCPPEAVVDVRDLSRYSSKLTRLIRRWLHDPIDTCSALTNRGNLSSDWMCGVGLCLDAIIAGY